MASTSSTPPARSIVSPKLYDVFISHRGPDVKQTLAKQLYDLLKARECKAFLDHEEIARGDSLTAAIQNAICSSRVQIAIFSKGYAKSSWCLDELVLMLKQTDALFIPVFYDVQPWELRHTEKEESQYAAAFSGYQRKERNLEKLDEWKAALLAASNISGYELSQHGDNNWIKDVAARVLEVIQLSRTAELVEDFDRFLSARARHEDTIVGIYGRSGSGKTTLARDFFNKNQSDYDASCFLYDVREAHWNRDLKNLQSQMLEDLFNENRKCRNTVEGIQQLKHCLGGARDRHFLIVLDDVDHPDQLDALLPEDSLSSGSLVIITTRDESVVRAVPGIPYRMKEMRRHQLIELFCSRAFRERDSRTVNENLIQSFVDYCGGLPLLLVVLGAYLNGRSEDDWKLLLAEKVEKIPPSDIMEILKISFDGLNKEEKQIFIDIACFSFRKDIVDLKSKVISIWNASGWNAEDAIQTLQGKCLVEVTGSYPYQHFQMHDLLRDLGRRMADDMGPPRLWQPHILRSMEAKGFKQILAETKTRCFHSFEDSFLKTNITYFIGNFSGKTQLLWLDIDNDGGNLRNIPSWVPLPILHVLTVGKIEEFWTSFQQLLQINAQPPLQLRDLRIAQCSSVQVFPTSIGRLRDLKKISLGFHGSSLPDEFCDLQSLEHLELSCCPKLSSLPTSFGKLKKLQHVDLSNCGQFDELPHSFQQLTGLKYLKLSCCRRLKLRSDMLKDITTLEYLDLTRCNEVEELPREITNQKSLTRLFVVGTNLSEVPSNIDELRNLEELRIGSPMLTSLPPSLGNLPLNTLLFDGCPQLEVLPTLDLPKQLRIRASGLRELPFGAATSNSEVTDQQALISASDLGPGIAENCVKTICNVLKSLWSVAENCVKTICNVLKSLWSENRKTEHESRQRGSSSSDKLPTRIGTLSLIANPQLVEIRMLPRSLKMLEISACKMLKDISGIGGLVNLHRLEICSCPELDELPSLEGLAFLKELKIQGCPRVRRVQGLEQCTSLEILTAEVPVMQILKNLEKLRRVDLTCEKISALKPCILSMKKCPWTMMVRGIVAATVKPIVDSLSWSNLSMLRLAEDSDWDNMSQDLFNGAFLWYEEENGDNNEESVSGAVNASAWKMLHIAVCRGGSSAFPEYCLERRLGSNPNVRRRKAVLATGGDERVVEAFHKLVELLR